MSYENVLNLISQLQALSESNTKIDIEAKLRIKLPIEYKQFLLSEFKNPPIKDEFEFTLNDQTSSSAIAYFLELTNNENRSITNFIDTYKNRIPVNTTPIAYDNFGNLILIENNSGKIYFWDHEVNDDDNCSLSDLGFIANSFTKFINGLK